MKNQKIPVISIIFFVLAGLILIFAVWSAVFSFRYIANMASMGQIVVQDNLFEIISFHFSNFGQYVVFAALLFGVGWILYIMSDIEIEAYFDEDDDEVEVMEELLEDLEAQDDGDEVLSSDES